MRLQLVAASLLVAAVAFGGDRVTTSVDVYQDDAIVAWIPQTRVVVAPSPDVVVNGGVAVDIVSGASAVYGPDVVSSASLFNDQRVAVDLAATKTFTSKNTLGGGVSGSKESDYATLAPNLSASTSLFGDMITASARYSPSFERVWMSDGDALHEGTFGQSVDLGWAQILDRHTTLDLLATGAWLDCGDVLGCQSNPYRWVAAGPEGKPPVSLRERHPDTRGRVAAAVKLSRAFGPAALHVSYRTYADTWRVDGHVLRASAAWEGLGEHLMLRAEGRRGWQSAASFFRDDYGDVLPEYRTSDRELAKLRDWSATGRVEWSQYNVGPLLRLGVNARVTRMGFTYPDTTWPDRGAWVIGGGFDAEL